MKAFLFEVFVRFAFRRRVLVESQPVCVSRMYFRVVPEINLKDGAVLVCCTATATVQKLAQSSVILLLGRIQLLEYTMSKK